VADHAHPTVASLTALGGIQTLGEFLRLLRRRAGLTQQELGQAVGYSREQITKLERNQRTADPLALRALFIPVLGLEHDLATAERLLALAQHAQARAATSRTRTTLPAPLTSFVGRESEVATVQALLREHRLVTLLGAGGVGKTRLAQEVGSRTDTAADGGVWFVDLAGVRDASLLQARVAAVLGLVPSADLASYLATRRALLILDNCEWLAGACAALAESLLRAAPELRVLSTSRRALGVTGGASWVVPPLRVPQGGPPVEELARYDAVGLFVVRASAVCPGFALSDTNAQAVAEICRRLDGLPLAIELAAAQTRALSVRQIADRVHDHLAWRTASGAPGRHRHDTLRSTIDFSYELLSPAEQAAFEQLSPFRGYFGLDAAQAVLTTPDLLELLTSLLDHSLLTVDDHPEERRFRLLEPVREYAHHRLAVRPDAARTTERYLDYYRSFVARANVGLRGAEQQRWYILLEGELDNVRHALEIMAQAHDRTRALELIGGLWFFWFWRGYWAEGVAWGKRVLDEVGDLAEGEREAGLRGRALVGLCALAGRINDVEAYQRWLQAGSALVDRLGDREYQAWARIAQSYAVGDAHAAMGLLEAALNLAHDAGEVWLEAETLALIGDRLRAGGHLETAEARYGASARLLRECGDQDLLPTVIGNLGRLAYARGEDAEAEAAVGQAVELCRRLNNQLSLANWLIPAVRIGLRQNNLPVARALALEGIDLCWQLGHTEAVADYLIQIARIGERDGLDAEAAALLGAADRLLTRYAWIHRAYEPDSYAELAALRSALEQRLGRLTFLCAWHLHSTASAVRAARGMLSPAQRLDTERALDG